ncbi:MAG: hypothetical protein RB294_12255 [Bacteroidales bacterium]|jgi:cell division protein FtsB|nr:hypothetical protein [Bacteroidales bacterium]HPE99449.1 hypothetical protein [Bacteroidales bacterium]
MKKKIWSIIKNKYFIATTVFVVWVGFFDQNNFIHQQSLRSELHKIRKERQFYLDEIHRDTKTYLEVVSNDERMEKFAREKYLMKRDNEDVFLIVYE